MKYVKTDPGRVLVVERDAQGVPIVTITSTPQLFADADATTYQQLGQSVGVRVYVFAPPVDPGPGDTDTTHATHAYVDAAVGDKATVTYVDQQVGTRATPADVAAAVSDKATVGYVDDAVAGVSGGGGDVTQAQLDAVAARFDDLALNLRDYGAVGDGVTDDSAAVQAWADDVIDGDALGYAPPGDYLLGSAITRTAIYGRKFAIEGAGIGVTRFIVPDTNAAGAFLFDGTGGSRDGQFTARHFSIVTQGVGNGTGLRFTMDAGGNQHQRSVILESLEVRGDDPLTDVFDIGIDLSHTWRPYVRGVAVAGPFGPGVSGNQADSSPIYVATAALVLDDAYDWTVDNCHLWAAKTALRDVGTNAEAGRVVNTVMAECRVGFDRYRTSPEPIVWVDNCHVNYRDTGFKIDGARLAVIRGCHPYNEDSANAYTGTARDIWLDNTERNILANNVHHYDGAADRICVDVDTSTLGTNLIVQGNVFSAAAARAVRVGAGASAVLLVGNLYPGTITQRVEDNSGTAIAMDHAGSGEMSLSSYDSSAIAGPTMTLRRDSVSPAANDVLGTIRTYGRNAAAAWTQYALMDTQIVDTTAGSEDGAFRMWAMVNGAMTRLANFQAPAAAGDSTGLFLLCVAGGVSSVKRVELGPADSAGTGYRSMRVVN